MCCVPLLAGYPPGPLDNFDPCSTWDYASLNISGDLDGNGALGLEDAILALRVLTRKASGATVHSDHDPDHDGKIGLSDALYILQSLADLR